MQDNDASNESGSCQRGVQDFVWDLAFSIEVSKYASTSTNTVDDLLPSDRCSIRVIRRNTRSLYRESLRFAAFISKTRRPADVVRKRHDESVPYYIRHPVDNLNLLLVT
jgi:hypothetical protein